MTKRKYELFEKDKNKPNAGHDEYDDEDDAIFAEQVLLNLGNSKKDIKPQKYRDTLLYLDILKKGRSKEANVPQELIPLVTFNGQGIRVLQGREIVTRREWEGLVAKNRRYFSETGVRVTEQELATRTDSLHVSGKRIINERTHCNRVYYFKDHDQRELNKAEKKRIQYNNEEKKAYVDGREVYRPSLEPVVHLEKPGIQLTMKCKTLPPTILEAINKHFESICALYEHGKHSSETHQNNNSLRFFVETGSGKLTDEMLAAETDIKEDSKTDSFAIL